MEIFSSILAVLFILYQIWDNKRLIKALSLLQIIGVILSFILYIGLATTIIYYGGNWFISFIPVKIIKYIVMFIIVGFTIYTIKVLLQKTLVKITNGIIQEQPYDSKDY
ncbi:hypothetical protein SH601_09795 [Gracilibacillus sp. S3-1-1]|uniref:Uncharacterized protein n=1 Tax=Gracilibacillus pellucidus TaxID=3095368 RepID=A0ACC6M5N8_9BACI|nr:hypothetical protein [Gracilibacillus sp. S3-1-1]MDX8046284.1 hypothetical protein [Gracilibacillus sp. S3-1-1]